MKKVIISIIITTILASTFFITPAGLNFNFNRSTGDVAVTVSTNIARADNPADPTDVLPACGGLKFAIKGCVAWVVYYLAYYPATFLVAVTGKFMDYTLSYSIDSARYSTDNNPFVGKGWAIVRDFSNIFFIFVLLYIAIGTVLGLHSVDAKKLIPIVIVVALLMNFSLFMTQVVIDAGNLLAHAFYNQMTTVDDQGNQIQPGYENTKQLSAQIAVMMNVDKLLDPKVFGPNGIKTACTPSTDDPDCEGGKEGVVNSGTKIQGSVGIIVIALLVISAVCLVAAYTFFIIAFLFIGRIVALWVAMIFAPIAFLSFALPIKIPQMGHEEWLQSLVGAVFFAPIFLFLLYLIMTFLGAKPLTSVNYSGGTGDILIGIIVPFMIIMGLLMASRKLSEKLAGETAGMIVTAGKAVTTAAAGGAIMLASGGIAKLGASTLGAAAQARLEKSDDEKKAAAGDQEAMHRLRTTNSKYKNMSDEQIQSHAKNRIQSLQKRASRSYDVRQTGLASGLAGVTGVNMNMGAGIIPGTKNLSTAATAGGYKGQQDRKTEEDQAFITSLGIDHHAAQETDDQIKKKKKTLDEQEEKRAKLKAQAEYEKQTNGGKVEDTTAKDLKASEDETAGMRKEITDLERKKTTIEKGYTRTYADFLQRSAGKKVKDENGIERVARGADGLPIDNSTISDPSGGRKLGQNQLTNAGEATRKWFGTDLKSSLRNGLKQGLAKGLGTFGKTMASGGAITGVVGLASLLTGVGPAAALSIGALTGLSSAAGLVTGTVKGLSEGGVLSLFKKAITTTAGGIDNLGHKIATSNIGKKLGGDDIGFKMDLSGKATRLAIADNLVDPHYKPGKDEDNYKPVKSDFFSFFNNLAKSAADSNHKPADTGTSGHGH